MSRNISKQFQVMPTGDSGSTRHARDMGGNLFRWRPEVLIPCYANCRVGARQFLYYLKARLTIRSNWLISSAENLLAASMRRGR